MNEVAIAYTEKDLLVYFQQMRLLKAKEVNDSNVNRTAEVKEEKTTLKGAFSNMGRFFERNLRDFKGTAESIDNVIEKFNKKNEKVMSKEDAEETITRLFEKDNYGLAKLLFSASIVLDNEYKFDYPEEGLKEVSKVLYGEEGTLVEIKKQLEENYRCISSKLLSSVEEGTIVGALAICIGALLVIIPPLAVVPAIGAIAIHEALEKNEEKIKEEFKTSTSETNAFFLALQCTYIQRIKGKINEDEFKEELDSILKNVNGLKADLDYYLFVEKESVKNNKEKNASFHRFDDRLMKILEIEK